MTINYFIAMLLGMIAVGFLLFYLPYLYLTYRERKQAKQQQSDARSADLQ